MSQLKKIIVPLYLFLIVIQSLYSQQYITEKGIEFDLEVRVVVKSKNRAIKNARVMVNGKEFLYNHVRGNYFVRAKVGEELIVSHPGFETVIHTIASSEEIKIKIEGFVAYSNASREKLSVSKSKKVDTYQINIDSAFFYKKKDFDKSVSFIENILKEDYPRKRNAYTYQLLGDIYNEWNQYDLAISNYKISLRYDDSQLTKFELAKSYILLNQFKDAERTLKDIKTKKLGVYYTILVYETWGDVYLALKQYKKANKNYNEALKIAKSKEVTPKITDLNSKLGDVSAAEGKIKEANTRFSNSLDLASKENPFRSIEEKEKVANYFNTTQQFDKEIDLRKKTLIDAKTINDSLETNQLNKTTIGTEDVTNSGLFDITSRNNLKNSINPQSINYKIGRAYVEKEDYNKAIPFLESSVKDADKNNDLVVKKDATRKLSEAYADVGDYDKALKNYREYVKLVDTLYNRKEQEISRAQRIGKKIADNENRIASLKKDKELNDSRVNSAYKDQLLIEEKNKNQEVIIYSLIGGIILMFVLASLLLKNNKQQKLANNLLALKSMRSQMNPHFIFNALNSVNSFIADNDERNANRYLSEFSVLMRSVLENSDEDFIPLAKEIELLELYVKLEHNRFKDKFEYTVTIDESIALEEFSIPPMLLQPYIENAIWHGLRYKEESGTLKIEVRNIGGGSISVVIEDDGVGRKKSRELKTKNQLKQKSKGMSTIQQRIDILNDMYQDRVDVQVSDVFEDGRGTKVELILKRK